MHFHWRTKRAARRLGKVVLGFIRCGGIANFLVKIGDAHPPSQKLRRGRQSFAAVRDGGSETAAPWLLTANSAPVYSRSRRGIEALQSRMVLVVH
jgi:hypothetical protein